MLVHIKMYPIEFRLLGQSLDGLEMTWHKIPELAIHGPNADFRSHAYALQW